MTDPVTVEVALRIRPLVPSEIARGCKECLEAIPNEPQVLVQGTDKAFTYNYVFGPDITQQYFYETAVQNLIFKLFKGYNVTILAYGQTGSGKTHSMGTSYTGDEEMGVIPRAVVDIFNYIDDNPDYEYSVSVSFMELYKEVLYDLLSGQPRELSVVEIREDTKGVRIVGMKEVPTFSAMEVIDCLIKGSQGRATGATAMNAHSSRSHAIFTISVGVQKKGDMDSAMTSKFHLVDLAGSERSKKTQATGERFREGININRGLLALGNVISALGDENQKGSFISYRDSKLTRLLQDSLGGNSMTLMIACVSPADYNLVESLSTLRYADRARKIKNKPIVNQDPKTAEINRLNKTIQQLRVELLERGEHVSSSEVNRLKEENEKLKVKARELTAALSAALTENTNMSERAMLMQAANEKLKTKLCELKASYDVTLNNLSLEQDNFPQNIKDHLNNFKNLQTQICDIQSEQKKNEEEIRSHESQSSIKLERQNAMDHKDFEQEQESHTKKQICLNSALAQLNRELALKELLASQLQQNTHYMLDHAVLAENENKIATLEKERDELMQQLKNVQSNNPSCKISEQRRKRVQELENQISDLKKKLSEMTRLIKLKEKDEERIKQLNREINVMKTNKVKLIKAMKAEADKFKTWRLQQQREVCKLKDRERKQQNQIVKMETMFNKQNNVLKRKIEEATAINKRLKDAMVKQKSVQEQRAGKTEHIQQWVAQELEVCTNIVDAQCTLEQLLEYRAMQSEQLERLRSDPESADTPEGQETMKQLTDDIELQSAQIADLQQKIIESDSENKAKVRWDVVQSMAEAKSALKSLFDLATDIRRKSIVTEYRLKDLQSLHKDCVEKLENYEQQIKDIELEHNAQLSNIQKENEEKVSTLLQLMNGAKIENGDKNLQYLCQIREEAMEKIRSLESALENYKEENGQLKKKIENIDKPKKTSELNATFVKDFVFISDYESDSDDNSSKNDPDWNLTPLHKRIRKMRAHRKPDEADRKPVKRSSDGTITCGCRGGCKLKICGCRKSSQMCNKDCRCENCTNKENVIPNSKDSSSDYEDSPKRTRLNIFTSEELKMASFL